MMKEYASTLHSPQRPWKQGVRVLPLLQARHGHVKARCLVDVETGLVQLESTSAHAQRIAVHLKAGCGVINTLPVQV